MILKKQIRNRLESDDITDVKVLSVDLFDTLVHRTCPEPEDIFRIQFKETAVLRRHFASQAAWLNARKSVEHQLTEAAYPAEINIQQIYEGIAARFALDKEFREVGLSSELRCEYASITPYNNALNFLRQAASSGKKIIIQTDTYLPADFIRSVLSRFVDFPFELRASSETQRPKRSGLAFAQLKKEFGHTVRHYGDNHRVDVVKAREFGVKADLMLGERQRLLDYSVLREYVRLLGVTELRTPGDGDSLEPVPPLREMAFRWAVTLSDFCLSARRYADDIGATEIWLLSRDCESIWEATSAIEGFWGDRPVKYMPASRAACHPIKAAIDSKTFARWKKREPDEADIVKGRDAIDYYGDQVSDRCGRILVVDSGWKGRLQTAIASALPGHQVFGYYFSVEPDAEPEARAACATFLDWDPAVFNQAVVEALAGFTGRSCVGFARNSQGRLEPTYGGATADRSPQDYCDWLRASVKSILRSTAFEQVPSLPELTSARTKIVKSLCRYPDRVVAECFRSWRIGINETGSDAETLITRTGIPLIQRLMFQASATNIWPRGAIWGVLNSDDVIAALYRFDDFKTAVRRKIRYRRRAE